MRKMTFVIGVILRLMAVGFVFYVAAVPLLLFVVRAHTGLQDDP
jgi:hypothetical protein